MSGCGRRAAASDLLVTECVEGGLVIDWRLGEDDVRGGECVSERALVIVGIVGSDDSARCGYC